MFVGDSERDRAASRADVEHPWVRESSDPREAALHHDLGLGTRHENARVDAEHQPPESPLADDVRERLARLAPRDEALERLLVLSRQSPSALERELRPRHVP